MNARIVCMLALVLFPSDSAASTGTVTSSPAVERVIAVCGSGSTEVQPDRLTVDISVSDHAKSSREAAEKSGKRVAKIRTALYHLGIPDTAITTGNLEVQPGWDQRRDVSVRNVLYARYHIVVNVREIQIAAAIVKTGLDSGADMIEGVTFSASNTDSARQAALAQAVTQARSSAETIASAAGGALGPMLQADSQELYGPNRTCGPTFRMAPGVAVPTSIPAGLVTVNARVMTRWRLDQ